MVLDADGSVVSLSNGFSLGYFIGAVECFSLVSIVFKFSIDHFQDNLCMFIEIFVQFVEVLKLYIFSAHHDSSSSLHFGSNEKIHDFTDDQL